MSAVPRLRFPEFDGKWLETNIGSCGNFYYGKSAPKWSVSEDAPTPCIRYGELYTKFGATVDKIYSRTNIDPAKLRFSKGGEVLVPRVGEDPLDFAKCTMLPFSGVAIGEMISVFETDQNSLFFTYYFNTMKNQFAKMVAGGNPSNLYYENLKPLAIWRPSLPEQQKIASFLSSVDKKIDLLRQTRDALALYKKGLMQKIFSQEIRFKQNDGSDFPDWEEVALGDVLTIANGRDYKHLNEGDVPVFGTGGFMLSVDEFLHDGESVGIGRKGTIDRPVFMSGKFWTVDTLFYTKDFEDVLPKFIYYVFKQINWLLYSEASGVPSLSKKTISKINFERPTISEQEKISSCLDAFERKLQILTSQIENMTEFKKGLLQEMFV